MTINLNSYSIVGYADMEEFVKRTLLYDFYGELLTQRQQEIYESVVLEDYSLSEVAQEQKISRQSVHDMIRRCDKILAGYEEKLHLVERFLKTKADVEKIRTLAEELTAGRVEQVRGEILSLTDRILEEL